MSNVLIISIIKLFIHDVRENLVVKIVIYIYHTHRIFWKGKLSELGFGKICVNNTQYFTYVNFLIYIINEKLNFY